MDQAVVGKPGYYTLKDLKGEKILGRVYQSEITKTKPADQMTYRIEKIIKKQKKNGINQLLVKFIGYKDTYWIKESDVEKTD